MKSAREVMSGTWGELWLDGELLAEVYKFQAKVTRNTTQIKMCGNMWDDEKTISLAGKGSIGLHKVDARLLDKLGDAFNNGNDPRYTAITKLGDPDAAGAERVAINDISISELTLADWEAAVAGQVECPFTFRGFKKL